MGTALLTLVSAIVGGLLVVVGDHLGKKAEDRRQWLRFAVENAATIVANKRQQRRLLANVRLEGRTELTPNERDAVSEGDRLADSLFFLAPVPEELRRHLRKLLVATNELAAGLASPEATWQILLGAQKQAVFDFETEVPGRARR